MTVLKVLWHIVGILVGVQYAYFAYLWAEFMWLHGANPTIDSFWYFLAFGYATLCALEREFSGLVELAKHS